MDRRHYLAGAGSVFAAGAAGGYATGRSSGDDGETDDDGNATEPTDEETAVDEDDDSEEGSAEEESTVRTILHLTSGDESDHDRALNNAENLLDDGTVELETVEFVVNGPAIVLYEEAETDHDDRIRSLAESGVAFKGCANSLDGFGLEESDLLEEVTVVPSAVGDIAKRQAEGYGYIKVP